MSNPTNHTVMPTRRLAPDQIRYLRERLWIGALRQYRNAAKGKVHIPGNYVIRNLNLAFGFEGWSHEIRQSECVFKETYDAAGENGAVKKMFRVIWRIEVRLTIHTPGGLDFCHDGTGVDEGASSSLLDCYKKAPAGALTYALKAAAIHLGDQFGLRVVRAGKDEGGRDYDWRGRTQKDHPVPPSLFRNDRDLEAHEKELDDDEGDPVDGSGSDGGNGNGQGATQRTEQRREEPRQEQRQPETQREPDRQERQDNRPAQQEQRREPEPEQRRQETRPSENNGGGNSQGNGGQGAQPFDRARLVTECRAAFNRLGQARAKPIFEDIAKTHGFDAPFVGIGRPMPQGPSDACLLALHSGLTGAT